MGTEKRERQKLNRQQRLTELASEQRRSKTKKRVIQVVGAVAAAVLVALIFNVASGDDSTSTPPDDTAVDISLTDDSTVDAVNSTTLSSEPLTPVTTIPGTSITGDTPCPATDGSQARATKFEKAPPMCIDASKKYTAIFDTTEGKIIVDLDTAKTPKTVNNFVTLARYKYYDSTVVFRTDVSLDIIQGGGLTNTDDPGYTIEDEGTGFTYTEGDLAMARTGAPNSAGGQWFFVTGPKAAALDGQGTYVNFAKVTEGLDVVKNILALSAGEGALGGVPSRNVVINKVTITES